MYQNGLKATCKGNVISSRGVLNDDDVICEICDGLASMLRYSTNTKERYATVEKEADYLEAYIRLLKCRYEHKLEYQITIQPEIKDCILPKLVLQQLVENSISHGWQNGQPSQETGQERRQAQRR